MTGHDDGLATGAWKRMCRIVSPDWVFGVLMVLIAGLVVRDGVLADDAGSGIILALAGMTLLASVLAAIGSRFDRGMIEDFHYRLMAQGAIVAVVSTLVVAVMADIMWDGLAMLGGEHMVMVLMLGWSVGYFYHRWRGLDT